MTEKFHLKRQMPLKKVCKSKIGCGLRGWIASSPRLLAMTESKLLVIAEPNSVVTKFISPLRHSTASLRAQAKQTKKILQCGLPRSLRSLAMTESGYPAMTENGLLVMTERVPISPYRQGVMGEKPRSRKPLTTTNIGFCHCKHKQNNPKELILHGNIGFWQKETMHPSSRHCEGVLGRPRQSKNKGFSLVEMLMALLVASLLMAALAPVITRKMGDTMTISVEGEIPGLKHKIHEIEYNKKRMYEY